MANKQRRSPALLVCVGGAALFLGLGSVLPLWGVPYRPRISWGIRPLDWEDCEIRRGALWESIAGTAGLLHSYHQNWQFENLVVGLVLLAAGAMAGLLFYWLSRNLASAGVTPTCTVVPGAARQLFRPP